MLVKCICTNCAGHLEFEEENAGEEIECPHCGFDTKLFLPGTRPVMEEHPGLLQKLRLKRFWPAASVVVVFGGFGYSAYRWLLPPIKDALPYSESSVFAISVLVAALFVISSIIALPIILLFQLQKITGVLRQIEINLRPTLPVYPEFKDEEDSEDVSTPDASARRADTATGSVSTSASAANL